MTLTHNHLVCKRTLNHLAKLFVYELSGCGFESHCSHLNFRYCACLEQEVFSHSGMEYKFTLKGVRDIIRIHSQMHRRNK